MDIFAQSCCYANPAEIVEICLAGLGEIMSPPVFPKFCT